MQIVLIEQLLIRDPNKRLGAKRGAEDIKNHVWFKGIHWEDVLAKKLKPPTPRTNFPRLNQLINMNIEMDLEESNTRNYMEGWSFVRK